MPGPLKDYWTEFDWGAELKKDDVRISTYMQELPRYIDLPSEDAVIMKHIQDKPELVPFGGDYKNSSLAGLFENTDYEEDITFSEEWQKRDGSDFYIVLGRLSKLWAQYFASLGGRGETVGGMRILCFYGKLMARCADIIDMEEDEYPALRVAIMKRLLADVNLLLGEFRLFGSKFPASRAKTDFHFEHVIVLREKMLTLLEKYRSGKNEK